MKTMPGYKSIFLVCSFLLFVTCKKEEVSSYTTATVMSNLTTGAWRVGYYQANGANHASDYNGYLFTFDENGQMNVDYAGSNIPGTWVFDESNNEITFNCGNMGVCTNMNHTWSITECTGSSLSLTDDQSSGNEELHMDKI